MNVSVQRRIASNLFKVGKNRVSFDNSKLDEIKEAITKDDIRALVESGAIKIKNKRGVAGSRAKSNMLQKSKGRRKGPGSRKGKWTSRNPTKKSWMNKIRLQRHFLEELKSKSLLDVKNYRNLRNKCKGGFFRSRRHLKLYINENNLINKK